MLRMKISQDSYLFLVLCNVLQQEEKCIFRSTTHICVCVCVCVWLLYDLRIMLRTKISEDTYLFLVLCNVLQQEEKCIFRSTTHICVCVCVWGCSMI